MARLRQSLNGTPYLQANKLVKSFKDDQTSSHSKTSIRLNQAWVDNISTLLSTEGADGFRIYFAKTADGDNTIVIVSTRDDGPVSLTSSQVAHLDYLAHDSAFLSTPDAQFKIESYAGEPGATMYGNINCPPTACVLSRQNDINCALAQEYVQNFIQEDINTNCVWFSLHFLQYLSVELKTAAAAEPTLGPFGIRIYFAKNNANYHTFIIVTTNTQSGEIQDYYECYNTGPYPVTNDNGEQCQPNCQGSTLPQN